MSPIPAIAPPASLPPPLKWHPGHYLKAGSTDGNSSEIRRVIDSPRILGVDVLYYWAQLEPTKDAYDFSAIDTDLDWLKARGKRLVVSLMDRRFDTSSNSGIVPEYLKGDLYRTTTGFGVALWRPAVMDRYIALTRALCARYDNEPYFEILRVPNESSPSVSGAMVPSDYTRAALANQLKRLFAAAKDSCTRTIVVASVNNLSGEEEGLINAAYELPIAFGSPDAIDDMGHRIFAGENSTSFDYRGRIAHYTIASSPVLGGKDNNGPAINVIKWAQTNKVTHLSWVPWQESAGNTWPDILSAIAASPNLYTACPRAYTQGCDGT